ncbi:CBS domain pair family protein [Candidatus Sulfobium mesophilum]|jgi:acetoin utilization protein AcuB|uniref:CBS domain pair family protein n=1 Tax=Candidatus Sulfobium mesophilum TaxID=2016548 RepID=A0A2U3QIU7_9BACT|nr:CBS domain pair family protein [Candidatus Sulfobium mesophilum]
MFVSEWMTRRVFSVKPDDSISEVVKMIKEKGIKHVPVAEQGRLKGIVSDRDIKDYCPSKATSLDMYELHYLLAKTKVREVMKTKVFTTSPDIPIEGAAMALYDKDIGCLPVVDDGKIVGIISDRDIFRALIDITGIRHNGNRIFLMIEDRPGSIKDVADIVRKHHFALQSILTSYERVREGYRNIVIRTKGSGNFKALKAELEGTYSDVRILKG